MSEMDVMALGYVWSPIRERWTCVTCGYECRGLIDATTHRRECAVAAQEDDNE